MQSQADVTMAMEMMVGNWRARMEGRAGAALGGLSTVAQTSQVIPTSSIATVNPATTSSSQRTTGSATGIGTLESGCGTLTGTPSRFATGDADGSNSASESRLQDPHSESLREHPPASEFMELLVELEGQRQQPAASRGHEIQHHRGQHDDQLDANTVMNSEHHHRNDLGIEMGMPVIQQLGCSTSVNEDGNHPIAGDGNCVTACEIRHVPVSSLSVKHGGRLDSTEELHLQALQQQWQLYARDHDRDNDAGNLMTAAEMGVGPGAGAGADTVSGMSPGALGLVAATGRGAAATAAISLSAAAAAATATATAGLALALREGNAPLPVTAATTITGLAPATREGNAPAEAGTTPATVVVAAAAAAATPQAAEIIPAPAGARAVSVDLAAIADASELQRRRMLQLLSDLALTQVPGEEDISTVPACADFSAMFLRRLHTAQAAADASLTSAPGHQDDTCTLPLASAPERHDPTTCRGAHQGDTSAPQLTSAGTAGRALRVGAAGTALAGPLAGAAVGGSSDLSAFTSLLNPPHTKAHPGPSRGIMMDSEECEREPFLRCAPGSLPPPSTSSHPLQPPRPPPKPGIPRDVRG